MSSSRAEFKKLEQFLTRCLAFIRATLRNLLSWCVKTIHLLFRICRKTSCCNGSRPSKNLIASRSSTYRSTASDRKNIGWYGMKALGTVPFIKLLVTYHPVPRTMTRKTTEMHSKWLWRGGVGFHGVAGGEWHWR